MPRSPSTIEDHVFLACVLEATAAKPGNVHPRASFADLTYADFVRSAAVVAPPLAGAAESGVGRSIWTAVERTNALRGGNPNLGVILLIAPLAAVPIGVPLRSGISAVLAGLTRADAELAYAAIRLARPGGLGRAAEQDVDETPSVTLLEAMRLAADRDSVAAQYATGFSAVLLAGVERIAGRPAFERDWNEAVTDLHLFLMSEFPDTLIARKCGIDVARESAKRARAVLESQRPGAGPDTRRLAELDAWLRADGNRRNPGTTADLVAATLFAGLRDGRLPAPPVPKAALDVLANDETLSSKGCRE